MNLKEEDDKVSAEARAETVLRQTIADVLGISVKSVRSDSILVDLGFGPMCVLDVIAALPTDWDTDNLLKKAAGCVTVQDLTNLID